MNGITELYDSVSVTIWSNKCEIDGGNYPIPLPHQKQIGDIIRRKKQIEVQYAPFYCDNSYVGRLQECSILLPCNVSLESLQLPVNIDRATSFFEFLNFFGLRSSQLVAGQKPT
jgi:hypothetical protein